MEQDFSAMDRMVELGMGMAMGQQVARSMNEMMDGLRRPPELQVTAQPLHAQNPIAPGTTPQPAYRSYPGAQVAPQQVSASPAAVGQVLSGQASQAQGAQSASESQVPSTVQPDVYYVSLEAGAQTGPIGGMELAKLVMQRKVVPATLVWKPGMEAWKTAADMTEVAELISLLPSQN